jgi:hypothetical protein
MHFKELVFKFKNKNISYSTQKDDFLTVGLIDGLYLQYSFGRYCAMLCTVHVSFPRAGSWDWCPDAMQTSMPIICCKPNKFLKANLCKQFEVNLYKYLDAKLSKFWETNHLKLPDTNLCKFWDAKLCKLLDAGWAPVNYTLS